jgi:predicted transglutaminase-like cysteine proteinase
MSAPREWVDYLQRNPDMDAEPVSGHLTVALARSAVAVHAQINAKRLHIGRGGGWDDSLPGGHANFVLSKRLELGRRGWLLGSLRFQQCIRADHKDHAVLVFVSDRGDFVSCDLMPDIVPWEAYPVRRWRGRSYRGDRWQEVDRRVRAARLAP